jgi:ABC-type amino acid transport substrate-binding protein
MSRPTAHRPTLDAASAPQPRRGLARAAFALSLGLALAAALPPLALAQAATPATLRVGVEGNYPPFSRMGPDGRLSGFDIDIANAPCAEMKVSARWCSRNGTA